MAIKILRLTDRLNIKIGEVSLSLAPLTLFQRQEMLSNAEKFDGKSEEQIRKSTILAMKYSIKSIDGIEDFMGNKYELSFDEFGNLTDNCVLELLNTEISDKMILSCYAMIYGMPNKIVGSDGKEVEGVEVVLGKPQQSDEKK